MREESKDREINLIDLLAEVLLHWRGIIVAMLIGGVLLGALSYVREYQVLKEQADQENALQVQSEQERIILGNQLSAGLTDLQLRRVNYVITHEKLYRDKANYLEHSVLMLLDPNDIRKAELTCYVACDDRQQSYDIEKVYEELIQSSEAMEYITTQMDGDSVDISEVVTIDRNGSQAMGGTNSFKVEVFHYKEEDCPGIDCLYGGEAGCIVKNIRRSQDRGHQPGLYCGG